MREKYLISEGGIVFIDAMRGSSLASVESESQDQLGPILAVDLSSVSSVGFGLFFVRIRFGTN